MRRWCARRREAEVLAEPRALPSISAAVPGDRYALGLRVMAAGKHYFTDKAPQTTFDQLAGQLVQRGAVGRVLQVIGLGPHRLADLSPCRPDRVAWP